MKIHNVIPSLLVVLLVPLGCDSGTTDQGSAAAETPNSRAGAKVNLNTASEDAFKAVPKVGDKMAHEFEEYRPYASIRQFRKEMSKYVDDATIAEYEKHVYVPVVFNDCDADTLQQIPGIGSEGAETLIAGRPYDDDDAFLSKVKEVGGDAAETAAHDLIANSPG